MKAKGVYRTHQNAIFNWAKGLESFCIEDASLHFKRTYDAIAHIVRRMHKAGLLIRTSVKREGSSRAPLTRWRVVREKTPPPPPRQPRRKKKADLKGYYPGWPARTLLEDCWSVRTCAQVLTEPETCDIS